MQKLFDDSTKEPPEYPWALQSARAHSCFVASVYSQVRKEEQCGEAAINPVLATRTI